MEKAYFKSRVGVLEIIEDCGICEINFVDKFYKTNPKNQNLQLCLDEINDYFLGNLREFNVSINQKGTKFKLDIYKSLLKIKYSNVITYKELAIVSGYPKAQRAVGNALGKNKIPIIIPCHRVVSSNGIGGYTGGIHIKTELLKLEGVL